MFTILIWQENCKITYVIGVEWWRMSNSRIMRICSITPSDVSWRPNLAKVIATIALLMILTSIACSIRAGIWLAGGQKVGQSDAATILEASKTVGIAVQNTANVIQIAAGGAKRRVEATGGWK